ncbi:MAG: FAD-dependent monooxygenase, partial [Pseudomonadota bacterium]
MNLQTEILIVGAGPVGLVTALLLEKLGIDYRLVERREGLHTAPQAHVTSCYNTKLNPQEQIYLVRHHSHIRNPFEK